MEEQQMSQKAYATEIPNLSDLKNYIGKELGLSEWTTISQNQIDTFARTTDDNQWIHVNPELAKKYSPYKKPIAHGFLILSFFRYVRKVILQYKHGTQRNSHLR